MELLGLLGLSSGNPQKDAAINQGLLSAGLALMQGRGRLGPALGQAGMVGLQAFQQSQQQQYQQQFQQAQLDDLKRKQDQQKQQDTWRQSLVSPQMQGAQAALAGGGGPTQANAARIPAVDPNRQMLFDAMKAGVVDPGTYLSSLQKDETPMVLGEGANLVTRGGRVLASNPKAPPDKTPEALRALATIYGENSPEYVKAARAYGEKLTTHPAPTQVNVSTDKAFGTTLAEGMGKQIDASFGNAKAAVGGIETAHRLKSAVDSGKLVAGPGASFRVLGLQLGQMLGVGGKDAAETLANTRTAIQSMAQSELDAAQQMKGQGQVTEAERDIIRRAASGDIDALTGPEIRLLADALEKVHRTKIKVHRSNVARLKNVPGAATLLPFYEMDEPPAYTMPGEQRVRRFNPATGKLED